VYIFDDERADERAAHVVVATTITGRPTAQSIPGITL
jgi:hypothetical protein